MKIFSGKNIFDFLGAKSVSISRNRIVVNGKVITDTVEEPVKVEVQGDVADLNVTGDVTMTGSVKGSADVTGDLTCGDIGGDADVTGNVKCRDIKGDVDIVGNIRKSI